MKKIRIIGFKKLWIAVFAVLAIGLLIFLCSHFVPGGDANTDPTMETKEELRLTDLLSTAKAIKGNLLSALRDIKASNWVGARTKLEATQKDIAAVQTFMDNNPLLMKLIPQAKNISELLSATDMAMQDVLLPTIDLLEKHPISDLSVGEGFDMKLLGKYIDFAEPIIPKLESLMEAADSVDFSILDSEGKITESLETAKELLDIYHENPEILSMLKTMLGAEEDRLYLIAVQNPSEIRASGGFPGFMGMLRIEDGILTMGEFSSVTGFLTTWCPKNVQITQEEMELFSYLSGIQTPRDADLCPDFERVGLIWCSSYEERHKESIAGVISMTPHIVQRLLKVTGEKIELSDGLVLNGDNVTKVLIHDIYFKYYNRYQLSPDRNKISDRLFAEAAQKTMEKLTKNISVSRLVQYLPVMKNSFEDRTLMLWMKDEKEQAFVVDMGWSGGLNRDPRNPEAGIYVNVISASKMGWFLLMDTEIGEGTKNADGSYTYPITVTLNNNITEEEINQAAYYILGGLGGSMRTVAYFFAPAGGSVDNFSANIGRRIMHTTYNGMALGFTGPFALRPNEQLTITYTVTTAPGVDTPLVISKTPTAQQP